ncbi:Fc.00g093770.m01.CDS01 [Cosmosporella sp. VM-42]
MFLRDRPGVTVRFVIGYEGGLSAKETAARTSALPTPPSSLTLDEAEPDKLVLEKEVQAKYAEKGKDRKRMEMEEKTTALLRGLWCSAY